MLYGQIVAETKETITFRVIANAGDASSFGIWGEHVISKRVGKLTRKETRPGRRFDQIWLPVAELEKLSKASLPIDCDLPDLERR